MLVTVGAKCWDGSRKKSLTDIVKVEGLRIIEEQPRFWDRLREGSKRLKDPKVRSIIGYTIPLMFLASGLPPFGLVRAFAQSVAVPAMATVPNATMAGDVAVPVLSTAIQSKILHAFDPLIDLIQSLSYPIAGVMIAGGCLFIMVGNRERGMQMLQNAAIGYILVQLSPMILELLVGIGSGV